MPAFGRDEMLSRDRGRQRGGLRPVALRSGRREDGRARRRSTPGKEVFAANCAACHGEDAKGNREVGRAEPDRPVLDLWRRRADDHRTRSVAGGRATCRLGRPPDAARSQDPGALPRRSEDAQPMSGAAASHGRASQVASSGCRSASGCSCWRPPMRISSTWPSPRSRTASLISGMAKATARPASARRASSCCIETVQ